MSEPKPKNASLHSNVELLTARNLKRWLGENFLFSYTWLVLAICISVIQMCYFVSVCTCIAREYQALHPTYLAVHDVIFPISRNLNVFQHVFDEYPQQSAHINAKLR